MSAELLAVSKFGFGAAQGIAAMGSKFAQASMFESDGIRLEGEARREASRVRDDGKRFAAEQKMQYIGSGVEVGGSVIVTLAQTDKWAETEAKAVEEKGRAQLEYHRRIGRVRRREGVASFISGIGKGFGDAYSVYNYAKANVGSGGVIR